MSPGTSTGTSRTPASVPTFTRGCCGGGNRSNPRWRQASRSAARFAKANWTAWRGGPAADPGVVRLRLAACAGCPLRRLVDGRWWCGEPRWTRPFDPADAGPAGCGCPLREKAQDPDAHCPRHDGQAQATPAAADCRCRWCRARDAA